MNRLKLYLVSLEILDAVRQDYERLRPLYYPHTDVFLICYSVVSPSSFTNVKEKWFPETSHHCPHARRVLVGTKVDLREDEKSIQRLKEKGHKPITSEQGASMAYDIGASFVECSSLTQQGLQCVFDQVIKAAVQSEPKTLRNTSNCIVF